MAIVDLIYATIILLSDNQFIRKIDLSVKQLNVWVPNPHLIYSDWTKLKYQNSCLSTGQKTYPCIQKLT